MVKRNPKLGEEVVGDPQEQIVNEPDGREAIALPASSIETIDVPLGHTTILLVGGGRRIVPDGQEHAFRVYDNNQNAFDHCHDAPDGEWVYKPA